MPFSGAEASSTMTRIILTTGLMESKTTFTSKMKTIKFTSEHMGAANQEVQVQGIYLKIVPTGSETLTIHYEADNQGTGSVTVSPNPFSYGLLGTTSSLKTFMLADSASDSTATDLVRDGDPYTLHKEINLQGRAIEFQISCSDDVDARLLGFEVEGRLAGKNPEYV